MGQNCCLHCYSICAREQRDVLGVSESPYLTAQTVQGLQSMARLLRSIFFPANVASNRKFFPFFFPLAVLVITSSKPSLIEMAKG
jgi:hypothetical protein